MNKNYVLLFIILAVIFLSGQGCLTVGEAKAGVPMLEGLCGNGVCNEEEGCENCSADCGSCRPIAEITVS